MLRKNKNRDPLFLPSTPLLLLMPDLYPWNESNDMEEQKFPLLRSHGFPYHGFHSEGVDQA